MNIKFFVMLVLACCLAITTGCGEFKDDTPASSTSGTEQQPTTPNQLTVTTVSASQIDLSWSDLSDNESGYRVERAVDAAGSPGVFQQIAETAANVGSYSDTSVMPDTTYHYRICSFNAAGNSSYTGEESGATPEEVTDPPTAPNNLQATASSTTQIDLTWNDRCDNENGYQVERAVDNSGVPSNFVQIAVTAADCGAYSDTGLNSETTYHYRIRGFNDAGESDYTDSVQVTTNAEAVAPPTTPGNFQAAASSTTQIDLTWNDTCDNENGYQIDRAADNSGVPGVFGQITITAANCGAYSDSGLSAETTYHYRIRGVNDAGESAYTVSIQATTLPEPIAAPIAPSILQATANSSQQISLVWNDNADNEEGHRIERALYSGGSLGAFTQIGVTGADAESYIDLGLSAESTYHYRVASHNSAGASAYSNVAIATTQQAQSSSGALVIGHEHTNLAAIPASAIAAAKSQLHIAYNHTSHGSQLITGMNSLRSFPAYGDTYDWDDSGVRAGALDLDDYGLPGSCTDLSKCDSENGDGDTPWAIQTRTFLDNVNNYHINVVVWSWCNIGGHSMPRYLANMEKLIAEYSSGGTNPRAAAHPVQFVFMTGHANGGGEGDSSDGPNQLIRQHCNDNERILFDFADIENYDPDGNYFLDLNVRDDLDYTGGNWATDYLNTYPGSELDQLTSGIGVDGYSGCARCSHSGSAASDSTLNCVLKGRAVWWLWARLAGWDGQ